jgi:glycosyltransferase involved in cell wall biosynthesis
MNILIATPLYPPQIGGPATYTVFLEKHLPKNGYEITVMPFTSVCMYPKIIKHIVYTYRLIRSARTVDILYALDTVSVGVPVRIASFLSRKPYILRVPGDYAWEQGQQRFGITQNLDEFHNEKKKHPFFVRFFSWLQSGVAQHARHVIVPSEYLKSIVMRWNVSETNITRIYSVLREISIRETKNVLRKECGFKNEFVITSAGRLVPWKGFHALIDVIALFHNRGISIRLEILGDGICRKELEAYVHECNLDEYIHFRGILHRDEMARYIKASDVFILNTAYEGLSHQLLDVMSVGVPIITTHCGGNPELIDDRVTGRLIPYNDIQACSEAIEELRTMPERARRYVETAKARIHMFHEDVVIQDFIRCITTIWK